MSAKYSERRQVGKEIILKFTEEDADEIFELLKKLVEKESQEQDEEDEDGFGKPTAALPGRDHRMY